MGADAKQQLAAVIINVVIWMTVKSARLKELE